MYNEKILNALNNLTYLSSLKNSTVSITSKKNKFGDTVKFYAMITEDGVIDKFTFKASGCTYFIVFCNYFCELVEGKTIKEALKINREKLENFVVLEDSRVHVADIIIATFAMLIKKYNKMQGEVANDNKSKKASKSTQKTAKSKVAKESSKKGVTPIDATNPNNIKQADNIIALNALVKNSKELQDDKDKISQTQRSQVNTLSNMINKINHKTDKEKKEENVSRLNGLQDSLTTLNSNKQKSKKSAKKDKKNKK